MTKQHFFFRLIPPRPTFAFDLNAEERGLMMQQAEYLRGHFEAGRVLAFGPVLDEAGSSGMALLEVDDRAVAEEIASNDPTVRAGMNTYTISPMRLSALQASPAMREELIASR